MTQIAKVAVAAATYAIDKPYDYLVPSGMELSVGCRVTVPFGRGNRTAEGMVLQLRQEVPAKPLKAIRSLLDQEPVLSEKEIRLALWMRQRYFCTFYDALHTILPAAVWYRYREIWSLCPTAGEEGLTEREQAVCRMLSDGPQAAYGTPQFDAKIRAAEALTGQARQDAFAELFAEEPQEIMQMAYLAHMKGILGKSPRVDYTPDPATGDEMRLAAMTPAAGDRADQS